MKRIFSFVLVIGLVMALPVLAQWEPDVRLTYNDSASYTSINNAWCVAATGDTVHVVWRDNRDGNEEIYTKRSPDGGSTWGADTRLTNDSADSFYPSVAASGSNVHVVWFDLRDGNEEIYAKRSPDGGLSWGADTRLTNDSADSYYPSVAASGSRVHVVWRDNRDGNYEIYTKRDPTGNSGVEENKGAEGPRVQGAKATPNPFTSFATLPGHEAERFSLYDISGRKVGTYRGDRVGEGLRAGVYFLRSSIPNVNPLRLVKLR